MDNIMGRVETKERMRLWDRERERKRARTLYYGNFLETSSDSWWWAGLATLVHVGQIACETRKSCWKKTDLKAKRGWKAVNQTGLDMGLDSFGWLPCAIQLRMTMYLILLARQKRWGSRPRAQFQLPEKKRKGQTTTQHKNADQRLPLFFCFPSPVSTNDNI